MTWEMPALRIKPPLGAEIIKEYPGEMPEGMEFWQNKHNKYHVLVCGYMADPDARSEEWWHSATDGLREDQINREYLIDFSSKAGQKAFGFVERQPQKYARPHGDYRNADGWTIPEHWPIIGGLDYGGNLSPCSVHFYAIDEQKDWHSIWEIYGQMHYRELCEKILTKGLANDLYERCEYIACDPDIWRKKQANTEEGSNEFIAVQELLETEELFKLQKGVNDRTAGLARVLDLFNHRDNERDRPSHMFISDDCPEQWREITELIYKPETIIQLLTKNPTDDVIKKDDHSYDDMRYAVMSRDPQAEAPEPGPQSEFELRVIESEMDIEDEQNQDEYFESDSEYTISSTADFDYED